MSKYIYTCWENKRDKEKTPDGEWILFLGIQKNEPNPKFPYEAGTGLLVHFWYGHGCLGSRHWDYRIFGTPSTPGIKLEFLKSINYVFVQVLEEWFEHFYRVSDDLYEQGIYRGPDYEKGLPASFRAFMTKRFRNFKEYEFENKVLRLDFSFGIFDEAVWCG